MYQAAKRLKVNHHPTLPFWFWEILFMPPSYQLWFWKTFQPPPPPPPPPRHPLPLTPTCFLCLRDSSPRVTIFVLAFFGVGGGQGGDRQFACLKIKSFCCSPCVWRKHLHLSQSSVSRRSLMKMMNPCLQGQFCLQSLKKKAFLFLYRFLLVVDYFSSFRLCHRVPSRKGAAVKEESPLPNPTPPQKKLFAWHLCLDAAYNCIVSAAVNITKIPVGKGWTCMQALIKASCLKPCSSVWGFILVNSRVICWMSFWAQ